MQIKSELIILTLLLAFTGVGVEAQMDPINDSRRANDSDMLTLPRRKRAHVPIMPVSGTIETMPR